MPLIHKDDEHRVRRKITSSSLKLAIWRDQFRVVSPEKGEIWVEGHATPERLRNGATQWYGYLWDITERKAQENQIRQLALYDPLTGLANRRLLRDRLQHATATAQRQHNMGALLMLDMDHFKILNDTQGHNLGDELLIEVVDDCNRAAGQLILLPDWVGTNLWSCSSGWEKMKPKLRRSR